MSGLYTNLFFSIYLIFNDLSHFLYYFLLLSPCCFQYRKIRFSNKQEPIKTEMG